MTSYIAHTMITRAFFTVGILSLLTGQFILSTTLFGMASLAANIRQAKPQRI